MIYLKESEIYDDDYYYNNCFVKFEYITDNNLNYKYFRHKDSILEINSKKTAYKEVLVEIL